MTLGTNKYYSTFHVQYSAEDRNLVVWYIFHAAYLQVAFLIQQQKIYLIFLFWTPQTMKSQGKDCNFRWVSGANRELWFWRHTQNPGCSLDVCSSSEDVFESICRYAWSVESSTGVRGGTTHWSVLGACSWAGKVLARAAGRGSHVLAPF